MSLGNEVISQRKKSLASCLHAVTFLILAGTSCRQPGERYIMERYLVELDGDQIELLTAMVREAIKVADEKKIPKLEALLSALGIMSWKAGDRRTD